MVRSREKEGHVLQQLELDDVWVCVHGETREEAVKGYMHMAKQRRIDRIHVQPAVLPLVRSAYPVATPSDHKAVVMQLGPPEGPTCPTRFRFPIEALSDEVAMGRLGEGLQKWADRELGPVEWWAGVTGFLQQEAREWRRAHPTSGYTEQHSLVRGSTPVKLAPGALEYLEELGYSPRSVWEGYGLLISLLANQPEAMFKSDMCERLKRQLQPREVRVECQANRRATARGQSQGLTGGGTHRGAGDRPGASGLLGGGHGGNSATEEECWRYVRSLLTPPKILHALPLLMKPLSLEVVLAALERLKGGLAPGKDGIPAELYQAFPSVFAPRLLSAMKCFLREGGVPAEWSVSLMRCLPKFWGAEQPKDMRPIALQQVCLKWVTTTVMLQLSDVWPQVIPPCQKGFVPGRQMLDHVIFARAEWERLPDQVMVTVDFQKAYDSVTFTLLRVTLIHLGLPLDYVGLLMSVSTGPILFCVGRGFVANVELSPRSGIRQGDPLSPLLFDLVTVLLIFDFKRLHVTVVVLLYADDIPCLSCPLFVYEQGITISVCVQIC